MQQVKSQIRKAEFHAVVYKADGTIREDLGLIAVYHSNPLLRVWYRFNCWRTSAMKNARRRATSWRQ